MLEIIICDFDGTLFDTFELNFKSYELAFKEAGYKLKRKDYLRCFGFKFDKLCDELNIPKSSIIRGDIHIRKKAKYLELCQNKDLTKINHNLITFLLNHKVSYPECKYIIATCASRDCVSELLKTYNILDLFDDIICGEDVKKSKPDPEIYDLICDRYNVTDETNGAIYEDSEVGLEAARKCKHKFNIIKVQI